MFVLVAAKPVEILNPGVVRIGFTVFHLCDQKQVYWIAGVVFCNVERMDDTCISKHIYGKVVLLFDLCDVF